MVVPFVFAGTLAAFRALSPSATAYWGKWTAVEVGSALIGVIESDGQNIRAHTHPQMTFLPTHGSNILSPDQVAACAPLGVSINSSDSLFSAIGKVYTVNAASFLHPDNF